MNLNIALGLVIVALAGSNYLTYELLGTAKERIAGYERDTKAQNEEAEFKLAAERERVAHLQRALKEAAKMQEKKDAERSAITAHESVQLRAATVPSGRLRDPHADSCRKGGDGGTGQAGADPAKGAAGQTETGGLLSAQLTALLGRTQLEADTINDAYASCRARLLSDRGLPPEPIDTE